MVITTQEELQHLLNKLDTEPAFIHVVGSSVSSHPCVDTPSSLHFLFGDGVYVCYAQNHPDAPSFGQLRYPDELGLLSMDKKKTMQYLRADASSINDISFQFAEHGVTAPNAQDFMPQSVVSSLRQFSHYKHVVASIPLTKWMEFGKAYLSEIQRMYSGLPKTAVGGWLFTDGILIPTLADIESAGIYTTDGYVYSDYNIHTSTGRPSNAFGGINFSALNKTDGTRKKFISRYRDNGTLVQFDYEAFHLRLAANLMGYELPPTPIHTYLAQQYYGTSNISEEQYADSKARTFAIMYGQTEDTGGVEFLERIREYIPSVWQRYQQDGHLTSGSGRKIVVPGATPAKVFNYLMQLTETEQSVRRIYTLSTYLKPYKAKVVLYTYDAILLDVPNEELGIMSAVSELLSNSGFPVRQYRGQNYHEMELYKI